MDALAIVAGSYFDGTRHHDSGPYTIEVVDGRIDSIAPGDRSACPSQVHVPFVMPGLVEAHCHLFLNGAELNVEVRKSHLEAPREEMLSAGRRGVGESLDAGITLIRDAGDLHGINTALKAELAGGTPQIISAGRALRKAGRYGSFMAIEANDARSIVETIHKLAPTADQLKVLLTGIIDFEHGRMKGSAQFSLEETTLIVRTARELGKRTFAHCSGVEGLRIALAAGIDSIEHGFFMERELVREMADKGIAWVPTFAPVQFQSAHPELAGWSEQTIAGLRRILEQHAEMIRFAAELGVPIVAGSDAGSYGVPHGSGLIAELGLLREAGLPLERVLASATSVPRKLWGCTSSAIARGGTANLAAFEGSPFESFENLRRCRFVFHGKSVHTPAPASAVL